MRNLDKHAKDALVPMCQEVLFCFVFVCLFFVFVFHGGMPGTNCSYFRSGLSHNIGCGNFYCDIGFVFKTLQIWEHFRFQKFRLEMLNLYENRKPKSGHQSLDFIEAEKKDENKSN